MTPEEILSKKNWSSEYPNYMSESEILSAMDEYVLPYKEIADLISRIFYYGGFKAETINERILERKLTEVGLWPTSQNEIINRQSIQ